MDYINNKERELYRIVDACVRCCQMQLADGSMNVTSTDVLGKSRAENVVMTRSIVVSQLVHAGYAITTCAQLLRRSPPAIRHLMQLDRQYYDTSRAYRIANAEAVIACKDLELHGL